MLLKIKIRGREQLILCVCNDIADARDMPFDTCSLFADAAQLQAPFPFSLDLGVGTQLFLNHDFLTSHNRVEGQGRSSLCIN